MNEPHTANGPAEAGCRDAGGCYQICIRGRLHRRWRVWFDGATLDDGPDGITVLHAHVDDQAALHDLIRKVADLGLHLVSVTHETSHKQEPPA
jgi:hypothetical protein